MVLMRGVCKALKAMHQYKLGVSGAAAKGKREAKKIRAEGMRAGAERECVNPDALEQEFESEEMDDADADIPANSSKRRQGKRQLRASGGGDDDNEEERTALIEDKNTNQKGLRKGEARSYAHRDIKPGNRSRYSTLNYTAADTIFLLVI